MPKPEPRRDPSPRRSNWSSSDRRSRLPSDWELIRKRVLRRDSPNGSDWRLAQCQYEIPGTDDICGMTANQVDHIVPGDDHRDSNLQSLCEMHHRRKSSSEGAAAVKANRRKIAKRYVRTEEHPGLL